MNLTDKERSLICNIATKLGVELDGDSFNAYITECCDHLVFATIVDSVSDDQLGLTDSEKEMIRSIIERGKSPDKDVRLYVNVHAFIVNVYFDDHAANFEEALERACKL